MYYITVIMHVRVIIIIILQAAVVWSIDLAAIYLVRHKYL